VVSRENPPRLSPLERAQNGLLAVAARRERAAAKIEIASKNLSIFDLINDPRPSIQRMKIVELLEATPGVGKKRALQIMEKAKISSSRRIAGLGRHQINALREELVLNKKPLTKGLLVVMSGPGGVGKSTISAALRKHPSFWLSVSATTRAPRDGEINGQDYFFISDEDFDRQISENNFLEWAEFAGNRYGTPASEVSKQLENGKNVLLEIEIAGARQIKKINPDALFIFIAPPSWDELEARLIGRGTDSPERRIARLALAREEMAAASEFDEILVNTEVNEVAEALVSLAAKKKERKK
jgi:guanylate kinase